MALARLTASGDSNVRSAYQANPVDSSRPSSVMPQNGSTSVLRLFLSVLPHTQ